MFQQYGAQQRLCALQLISFVSRVAPQMILSRLSELVSRAIRLTTDHLSEVVTRLDSPNWLIAIRLTTDHLSEVVTRAITVTTDHSV
jgi:hypothetical protein